MARKPSKGRKFAKKPTRMRRRLLALGKWTATFGVWLGIIGILLVGWYATDLPDVDAALDPTRKPTVRVVAADGTELATHGELYGLPVKLSELPAALPRAVLATEDRRFYSHFGLDLIGLARAVWTNLRAGRIRQGGSTLTQQVAKNLFLTPERTIKRKVQELLLALWLERKFSKDQILTVYLNRVYLGAGTYGVDAAARKYFGRSAPRLDLWQSAMLAGLLKAPSRYNPKANRKAAAKRTRQVLANMVAAGYLTADQARRAKAGDSGRVARAGSRPGRRASHFVDWVLEQVGDYVGAGDRDLVVVTTLDADLQAAAERQLREALRTAGAKARIGDGAILVMDAAGAVRAMVGGRDHGRSQFNRATQARRQPGSAFKPVVYLAAIEEGLTPESIIEDAPIRIGKWRPKNFDGRYRGAVTVADALARSLNTPAVRVARNTGAARVQAMARRLGLGDDIPGDLGIALGTHETTLLALTAAYGVLASGGQSVLPHGITEIRDGTGRVLYRRQGGGAGPIVDALHVAQLNGMLAGVVEHGTGRRARLVRPAAGKTGTSQNYRDAWFMGFTSDLVAGVWLGNDNGRPMKGVTGGGLPATLWRQVMQTAHQGRPIRPLSGLDSAAAPTSAGGFLTRLVSVLKEDADDQGPEH